MKKILCVASECAPFAKTGGLADVIGALPKNYNKDKIDIRVMLPKYKQIPDVYTSKMNLLTSFYIMISDKKKRVDVYTLTYNDIIYYFIDNKSFFSGKALYEGAKLDIKKFVFFDKACLKAIEYIDFVPNIIHCNDWQTGLIPAYLRDVFSSKKIYKDIKTILTIHNLQFQGKWNIEDMKKYTGLSDYMFTWDKLVNDLDANFLKGGMVFADYITTVSKTYAKEITNAKYGEGLDKLICQKKNKLYGIVNGIDYDEYNATTDPYIYKNYDIKNVIKGKQINKEDLQREFGLKEKKDVFLIGIVSRLTEQKGMDLIKMVIEELANMDIQLIVLGTGDEKYENFFRHYASKYKDKISANIYFSEEKSRKIYAGCDAFLMPSMFEPCGLGQLISYKYGTIPIVRETGGLKDTVIAYNEYEKTGTGYSFKNYDAYEMLHIIRYAEYIYKEKNNDWNEMIKRCMKLDYSWKSSALEYEKLYDKI